MNLPPSLYDSKLAENLSLHVANLTSLGYWPGDMSGSALKLRDLYCPITDTYFECKTDSHYPRNLCIELVGNLPDIPNEISADRFIKPNECTYPVAVDFIRDIYAYQPNKLSLGLDADLEQRHSLSYVFSSSGAHYVFDIRDLQRQHVIPAIREKRYSLLWSQSFDNGSGWFSISMLIPVADAQTI